MEFLPAFLTSTFVVILIVIAPGPDTALVVKNSITRSRKDGFATTLGIVLGNTIYVSLGLVGLGALFIGSPTLFTFIRYTGAAYMAYLGVELLLSKKKDLLDNGASAGGGIAESFKEGLFTNLSNPKFLLFFLAFFVQFITPGMPLYLQALYGYQISVIALIWFALLTVLFTTPSVKSRITPLLHYVEKGTGLILIIFAVLALSGA